MDEQPKRLREASLPFSYPLVIPIVTLTSPALPINDQHPAISDSVLPFPLPTLQARLARGWMVACCTVSTVLCCRSKQQAARGVGACTYAAFRELSARGVCVWCNAQPAVRYGTACELKGRAMQRRGSEWQRRDRASSLGCWRATLACGQFGGMGLVVPRLSVRALHVTLLHSV